MGTRGEKMAMHAARLIAVSRPGRAEPAIPYLLACGDRRAGLRLDAASDRVEGVHPPEALRLHSAANVSAGLLLQACQRLRCHRVATLRSADLTVAGRSSRASA